MTSSISKFIGCDLTVDSSNSDWKIEGVFSSSSSNAKTSSISNSSLFEVLGFWFSSLMTSEFDESTSSWRCSTVSSNSVSLTKFKWIVGVDTSSSGWISSSWLSTIWCISSSLLFSTTSTSLSSLNPSCGALSVLSLDSLKSFITLDVSTSVSDPLLTMRIFSSSSDDDRWDVVSLGSNCLASFVVVELGQTWTSPSLSKSSCKSSFKTDIASSATGLDVAWTSTSSINCFSALSSTNDAVESSYCPWAKWTRLGWLTRRPLIGDTNSTGLYPDDLALFKVFIRDVFVCDFAEVGLSVVNVTSGLNTAEGRLTTGLTLVSLIGCIATGDSFFKIGFGSKGAFALFSSPKPIFSISKILRFFILSHPKLPKCLLLIIHEKVILSQDDKKTPLNSMVFFYLRFC